MNPRALASAALCAAALAAAPAPGAAIWVSPLGNDVNPGTEEAPLHSVERARDLVRASNGDMKDDITVFIAGTYRLSGPIELGPEDSATNGYNIIYTSAPGEHPVLSGAVSVGGWSLSDRERNLWAAPIPHGLASIHCLYVNGRPCAPTRARLPARGPDGAPAPAWRYPADVGLEGTGENAVWSARAPGAAYAVNALENLGRAGEWCLDRAQGRIFYTPRPGEDLARADVEATAISSLLVARGSDTRPIAGIVVKGIRFEYADVPVRFANAESLQFLEDRFLHAGPAALSLQRVAGVSIEGCLLAGAAGPAVDLVSAADVRISDSRLAYVGLGSLRGAAVEAAGSSGVMLERVEADHYPLEVVRSDGAPAKLVSVRADPPMVRLHGEPPAAAPAPGGISEVYASLGSEAVMAGGAPDAPTDVGAEAVEHAAYVTWIPPLQDGGSPVTGFTVTASSGAVLPVTAESFYEKGYALMTGLDDNGPVSFTVSATSSSGVSIPSLASPEVTPLRRRRVHAPSPPARVSVTMSRGSAAVAIDPPSSSGTGPVVAYEVSIGVGAQPETIEGLDVVHADAAHPLRRVFAGLRARPAAVAVAAVNSAGPGRAAVVSIAAAAQTPNPGR